MRIVNTGELRRFTSLAVAVVLLLSAARCTERPADCFDIVTHGQELALLMFPVAMVCAGARSATQAIEEERLYKWPRTEYETRIASAFAKRMSEAECGNAWEQYHLGIMFWLGNEPATEDPVAAYMWLSLAVSNGLAEAEESRNRLAAQMTDAQIAAAESLVGVWEPNRLCTRAG